jgi:hypothetical protein
MRDPGKIWENDIGRLRHTIIHAAFPALRKAGLRCRANFKCCSGCASVFLGRKKEGGLGILNPHDLGSVFWHRQDEEAFQKRGKLYLRFGAPEQLRPGREQDRLIGNMVVLAVRAALAAGMPKGSYTVTWDGNPNKTIVVEVVGEKKAPKPHWHDEPLDTDPAVFLS